MTPLRRAQWRLGLLEELAQPGHMALAAVWGDGGDEVIDFTWQAASPTATLALGCAGEDLVGRRLKPVLVACAMDAKVFATYRAVFLEQRAQTLGVDGQDGLTVHAVSPLPGGLSVEVTLPAALERVLAAQQAVRALK
ncbi:MAG: hypothetical protein ACI9M6_001455 [Hydrogenophaga sp.]|jgi:hypothetical protein